VPASSPVLVLSSSIETEAILGKASPRNPNVRIRNKSCSVLILLVACLLKAVKQSSEAMPSPLSNIRIFESPASSSSISITVLFASIAFSTSSFTTEAGRSTTSPAAILFESSSESCTILPTDSLLSIYFFFNDFCSSYIAFIASKGVISKISSSFKRSIIAFSRFESAGFSFFSSISKNES